MEVLNVQEQLLDHENRIKSLEKSYDHLIGEIITVKNGQLQVENTVLKTSQDQNGLLNTLITNSFDLKKTRIITRKDIIIACISGGGILGVIVGAVLKFL